FHAFLYIFQNHHKNTPQTTTAPKPSSSSSSSSTAANHTMPAVTMTRIMATSSSPNYPTSTSVVKPTSSPPLRQIPGSHGWPVVGPMRDRLDYFWFQGPEAFFKKRMEKYKSTVFRTNVPPAFPFLGGGGVNPNVVAVLDCRSFSHMFDMEVVEKKDVLVGDFMPSVGFTGNMRTCAYLDTSEPKHAQIKQFVMHILKRSTKVWVSELQLNMDQMWATLESELSSKSSAGIFVPLQQSMFKFLTKSLVGVDVDDDMAKSGPTAIDTWLGLQLLPTVSINVIQPLEEIFFHSFPYPSFLVSGGYNKLADFIRTQGREVVQLGVTDFGLSEEEAVHNLLFTLGFNAFGGFSVFLPSLFGRLLSDKTGLQDLLRLEARENGGPNLTFDSVKQMPLIQSVVYETLRLSPPVPNQFARARKDFQLSSYDASYEVKKGELLFGFQPLVMQDPMVFDDPESFKPDRFMGQKGEELLNYLYWSNGPQTGSPSESNKQCSGKDIVTLTATLIVAHLFRRYDSISGDGLNITALEKAK
ncbi:Fatty acid hydroperoxide lyase, chloroplastic, partial [Linum grandiflorum]